MAREILAELGKDDWSVAGDWAAAEARLLELGSDALPSASSSRFVFGSLIKDLLTSIVAAAEGKSLPRLPDAVDGSARHEVKMGMAAPGFNAELWAEGVPAVSPTPPKGADDDADPWRSALPCADGTVCLVLGAGNQSFLSLVEVLGRCLLDGDAVLLKHHPLRPWLAPPYAALLAPTLLPPLPCRWLYPSMWCLCPPSSIAGTARCSRRSRGAASSPRPSTRASRVRTAARTLPFTTPHRHSPPASVNASPSRPLPHNLIVRPWFVSRTRHDGAADRPARRPRLPHRLRGDRDRRARHTRRRGRPSRWLYPSL